MDTSADRDNRAYVLLVRHARADEPGGRDAPISEDGRRALARVAEQLYETLDALTNVEGEEVRIGALIHGASGIATETATILRKRLERAGVEVGRSQASPDLDGRHASPLSPLVEEELTEARKFVLNQLGQALDAKRNAVLVVGHQPALGIIAQRLTGDTVPIGHGAVACVKGQLLGKSFLAGTLRWVIAPSDPTTMEQLRAKIVSKMQVAALLAGLIGTGLIFVIQNLITASATPGNDADVDVSLVLQYVVAVLLFLAAALNLATVYAYDLLLMPTRFWAEPRGLLAPPAETGPSIRRIPNWLVWRPPSSDQLVVYQNMIRIWRWLFIPATGALGLGVALMALVPVRAADPIALIPWIVAEAAVAVLFVGYVRNFWPVLGVED